MLAMRAQETIANDDDKHLCGNENKNYNPGNADIYKPTSTKEELPGQNNGLNNKDHCTA